MQEYKGFRIANEGKNIWVIYDLTSKKSVGMVSDPIRFKRFVDNYIK